MIGYAESSDGTPNIVFGGESLVVARIATTNGDDIINFTSVDSMFGYASNVVAISNPIRDTVGELWFSERGFAAISDEGILFGARNPFQEFESQGHNLPSPFGKLSIEVQDISA